MPIYLKYCSLTLLFLIGTLISLTGQANVLIFTDQEHPVINAGDYPVIYLDAPSKIAESLSLDLSSNPTEAAKQANSRIQDPVMQQQLMHSYLQVVKAWQLGITKIPAIVVDDKYVVYGQADIQQALQQINIYKNKE